MTQTIDHAFRWWARSFPDRVAIALGGDPVSYAALDRWVGAAAAHLVQRGVRKGDRVVIVAENSIAWCVVALASLRIGALAAGLSTRMVRAEIDYIVSDYDPVVIVHDVATAEMVGGRDAASLLAMRSIEALRDADAPPLLAEVEADDASIIVTTSGSTARPKGVVFSHRSIIDSSSWQFLSDPVDRYARLLVAPLSTSAGIIPLLHTILCGGTAFLEPRFEAEEALRLIVEHRINIVTGAPIFFERMAAVPAFAAADLSFLRIAHTGGATVAQALLETWSAKGVLLRQMYGQTECGGTVCVNPREFALSDPERCGGSMMFTEIAIVDPAGKALPAGVSGEIIVRGPGLMTCYWNNPEATAKVLAGGWLRTGDIGSVDERGRLKFVDRLKDIIISGGLNISAAEVERVLLDIDGIDEAAVISAPDEKFGEVPMAIVHGASVPQVDMIMKHCTRELSRFKHPSMIIVETEPLPRLASGKISKPALRAKFAHPTSWPDGVR